MTIFSKLFRNAAPMSAADLKKARSEIDLAAIDARIAKAAAARKQALLIGEDSDVAQAEAALARETLERERTQIAVDELDRRIVDAERTEKIAAFVKQRDAVRAQVEAAAKAVRERYPSLARELAALVEMVKAANAGAAAWNSRIAAVASLDHIIDGTPETPVSEFVDGSPRRLPPPAPPANVIGVAIAMGADNVVDHGSQSAPLVEGLLFAGFLHGASASIERHIVLPTLDLTFAPAINDANAAFRMPMTLRSAA